MGSADVLALSPSTQPLYAEYGQKPFSTCQYGNNPRSGPSASFGRRDLFGGSASTRKNLTQPGYLRNGSVVRLTKVKP